MGLNIGQRKLTTGDTVIGGALVVGLISLFLPWFSASFNCGNSALCSGVGSTSASTGGLSSGWGWLYLLAILVTGGFLAIRLFFTQLQIPTLPLGDWLLYLIGGAVTLVAGLLFYTSVPHGGDTSALGGGFSYGVSFGWIVALAAAVAICVGAYLKKSDPQPVAVPRMGSAPPPGGYGSPTGYAPPQQGYAPPQQGYTPPQQGYVPPQQAPGGAPAPGYGQPQPGQAPPAQGPPGQYPPPQEPPA